MASTSAWKSPISILMGARRNDDLDLELRDDHSRDSPIHHRSSHAAATPLLPPGSPGVVKRSRSGNGLTTYFPFGYLYSTTTNEAGRNTNNQSNGNNGYEPAPPRGAFPPPLNDTPLHGEEGEQREEYVSSHPWYHQNGLIDTNDDDYNPNLPDENPQRHTPQTPNKKSQQTQDEKAILATTFNFTNAIIGAGAMGLGGAFAQSGGLISILSLLTFAYLTKRSVDLIVDLTSCELVRGMVEEEKMRLVEEVVFVSGEESEEEYSQSEDEGENDAKSAEEQSAKGDEETAPVRNQASPLMAQEQSVNNPTSDALNPKHGPEHHDTRPGINRYDSLNNGSESKPLPIFNIDSDGLPINLQDTQLLNEYDMTNQPCTYEELGWAAYGTTGRLAVLFSKCLYSFGCLVAYVVVVRDNFGPALRRMVGDGSGLGYAVRLFFWSHGNGVGCDDAGEMDSDRCRRNITDATESGPAWLHDDDYLAFLVSAMIMLPLSCPRTMDSLAKFSLVSVVSIMFLAMSVVYLYFSCIDPATSESTFYENWIEIRSFSGFMESLGTFVFTFVCHHTVNLAYESLPAKLRNPTVWRTVSKNSIVMSTEASMAIGLFAYMTFGANTPADVLVSYPPDISLANISRLLLCLTMVLTFPLPFLTCREMLVLIMVDAHRLYYLHRLTRFNIFSWMIGCITVLRRKLWTLLFKKRNNNQLNTRVQVEGNLDVPMEAGEGLVEMQPPVPIRQRFTKWSNKLWFFNREEDYWDPAIRGGRDPLLSGMGEENPLLNSSIGGLKGEEVVPSPLSSPEPSISSSEESFSAESIPPVRVPAPSWLLINGNGRQLSFLWHAALTFTLWMLATVSAIKSPSLGDVLDLVGAFTGTLLAFVLPALFAFKLKGYSHNSCAILTIGGFVGIIGTISSFVKFVRDIRS